MFDLSGWLPNLAFSIALGTLLDRIIMPPATAESIISSLYAKKDENNNIKSESFDLAIKVFNDRFFKTLLGQNPLTIRYALRSVIFSLFCITLVVLYQSDFSFNGIKSAGEELNNPVILILIIISNLFVDYISLFQTQIFLNFAINTKSRLEKTVAIISDVIVTSNLFIFFFPAMLALIVGLFLIVDENRILHDANAWVKYSIEKNRVDSERGRYTYTVSGVANFEVDGEVQRSRVVDMKLYSDEEIFNPIYFYSTSNNQELKLPPVQISEIKSNDKASYDVESKLEIEDFVFGFPLYYGFFISVDKVEDGFIEVLQSEVESLSIR